MCVYTDRDRSTKIFCEFSPPPRKSRSAGGFSNRRVPTPTPTRDPAVCATKIGFVSPGNTATGAAATGSRVSQSSSSDVGRSAEPSGRVKRGRADVESSFSLSLCVSLWLSGILSLSLSLSRRVGPGADEEEGIGNRIKSNQSIGATTTTTTKTGGRIVPAARGTGACPRRPRSATGTTTTNRDEGHRGLEVRTTTTAAVRGDFVGDSPSEATRDGSRGRVKTMGTKKDASAAAMSASAPSIANVAEISAETDAGARERVRFYELCSPRMLGQWLDDRTCVVSVRGGARALRGAGEEMMRYLRDRLGVVMELDAKRERVLISHSVSTVVIEAARILHLQLEQAKLDDEAAAGLPDTPTPTTFETGAFSPSSTDDAVVAEVMREIDATALEELRRRMESKRATRARLIETLGEPRVTCHLQPIELENTLVRVRLPRKKSFNETKRYAIGVALRAVASFSPSTGKPTWIFQCDMGGAKPIETDVIYLSNDAITIPEVCRLIISRRNAVYEPKDVVDELLPPASEAPASA